MRCKHFSAMDPVPGPAASFWNTSLPALATDVAVESSGLTSEKAYRRLERYGTNTLRACRQRHLVLKFFACFNNPLVLILLGASLVSALTGEVAGFAIISLILIMSMTLEFVQELRSGKAAERLGSRWRYWRRWCGIWKAKDGGEIHQKYGLSPPCWQAPWHLPLLPGRARGDVLRDQANERGTGQDVGIETKVTFLKCPEAYSHRPPEVRAIETHMSWVFLAGPLVYKLKKPVRYSYLDFSTLPARRRYCSEEIRLNRRLAPGVYLGKVALTRSPEGRLRLGGTGPVVDWLVKMRLLPEERMLDRLLLEHALAPGDLPKLVAVLTRFYGRARRVAWPPGVYVQRLRQGLESNAAALLLPRYGLPAGRIRAVLAAQRTFLTSNTHLLEARVRAGHIVDGHGDLRPEHVCLEPIPVIIDCLEFSRELRLVDAADEIAFLALECERLGSQAAGEDLLDLYSRLSGDSPPLELIRFYQSCRACLRAKLAIWHLDEQNLPNPGKWLERTLGYLNLAEKYGSVLMPRARP